MTSEDFIVETPFEHAVRRATELYLNFRKKPLTQEEYNDAVKCIREGGVGFSRVHTEKDGQQVIWKCFIRGETLYGTYCRARKVITTFLPPGDFCKAKRGHMRRKEVGGFYDD